jgi:hypothetical protein
MCPKRVKLGCYGLGHGFFLKTSISFKCFYLKFNFIEFKIDWIWTFVSIFNCHFWSIVMCSHPPQENGMQHDKESKE